MVCGPSASVEVVSRASPKASSACAEGVPSTVNVTLPVGMTVAPVSSTMCAVNVTGSAKTEGLSEEPKLTVAACAARSEDAAGGRIGGDGADGAGASEGAAVELDVADGAVDLERAGFDRGETGVGIAGGVDLHEAGAVLGHALRRGAADVGG